MSLSSKITDDEMRFFQFKARQLYQLRKEDHEWNEFCKRNACTCCSCQPNIVPKDNKEIGIQSSSRRNLPTSTKAAVSTVQSYNRNLPQTLNELKIRLEKIDLALSERQVPVKSDSKDVTKPKEIFNQQMNSLAFPLESEVANSVRSVINERRIQLIQDSLKMSLQRLQSAALRNTRQSYDVKSKKKSCSYFIPRDLERQRAAARRAYLASLEKPVVEPKSTHSNMKKNVVKNESLKPKSLKATTKSNFRRKYNKIVNQKEDESTLVESKQQSETKDENIEAAVDAIMDDILGETVLVINKIKQSKSEKSSIAIPNTENIPINVSSRNVSINLNTKEAEEEMFGIFQDKLEKIRSNIFCSRKGNNSNAGKLKHGEIKNVMKVVKDTKESDCLISPHASSSNKLKDNIEFRSEYPLRDLSIHPTKAKYISECRNKYWNYLERMSRTKKGNFDPWALSNLVAESLLDDCIQEVANELQEVPASLISDLYDQEFLQDI